VYRLYGSASTGATLAIEGIRVYRVEGLTQLAFLCSGRLLRAITYGVVRGWDDIAVAPRVGLEPMTNGLTGPGNTI